MFIFFFLYTAGGVYTVNQYLGIYKQSILFLELKLNFKTK